MEGKMKMVSLVVVLVVGLVTLGPVLCERDESRFFEPETTTTTTTTTTATEEIVTLSPSTTVEPFSDLTISKKKSDLIKFGFYDKKKADRGLKPFVYGKKFQLQNEFNVDRYEPKGNTGQEKLISPLITSPIRLMPYVPKFGNFKNAEKNRVINNVGDSPSEIKEDVKETENTTADDRLNLGKKTEEKIRRWKTRRNGDRSLMVVLPFSPSDNGSVEEFFTKKPLVRMMEAEDLFKKKENNKKERTTFAPPRESTLLPTTTTTTEFDRKSFLTRKPWRPSKRSRLTTESYLSTTEFSEDATRTYTTYNDVEQVTRKFHIQSGPEPAENHNYDLYDVVTSLPVKRLRNKTPVLNEEFYEENETAKPTTNRSLLSSQTIDLLDLDADAEPNLNFKLNEKNEKKSSPKTTENPSKVEGLSKVLEILPADMKDVILELDFNKEEGSRESERTEEDSISAKKQAEAGDSANSKLVNFKTIVQPPIDPKSYAVFKPIPIEIKEEKKNVVSEDMKTFLASFGLLPVGKRQQKSLKTPDRKLPNEITGANLNFLPEDMKSVLRDMGLMKYGTDKDSPSIHIFNPSNHSVAKSDEDFEKVKTILNSIKSTVNESESITPEMQSQIIQKIKELNELRYTTGNLTEINEAIKRIVLNKLPVESRSRQTRKATKLSEGPNPLLYTEENLTKNDVKRQVQTSSSSSSSASSSASGTAASSSSSSSSVNRPSERVSDEEVTTTMTTADPTTTEENPNLEALKESFGGGDTASDSEDVDSALPPKRPNGLYFLFDWNSFFEVGTEDDSRRVNLRFQPKIGDSRNFLPVSIP